MIQLSRLSGSVFLLNSDLIERVDATPDTVVTLVDGTKYVVAESLEDVAHAVLRYRGQIVALGSVIQVGEVLEERAHLAAVTPMPPASGTGPRVTRPREA